MLAEVAARDHRLMMRSSGRFRVIRGGTPIGGEDERRNRPSLHDADQHYDDLAGVRGHAPGAGSDPSGFLASDLAAEPRVFTEQGRPADGMEERSMEAITVAPEEPSAPVGFSGRTGHWAKVVPAILVHERLPSFDLPLWSQSMVAFSASNCLSRLATASRSISAIDWTPIRSRSTSLRYLGIS